MEKRLHQHHSKKEGTLLLGFPFAEEIHNYSFFKIY